MAKLNITNVVAEYNPGGRSCVQWQIAPHRFHVWLEKDGQPEETIFKNDIEQTDKYRQARRLDRINSKATAVMFAEVWAMVEATNMLAKAKKDAIAERAREQRKLELEDQRHKLEQRALLAWRESAFNDSKFARDLLAEYAEAGRKLIALAEVADAQS